MPKKATQRRGTTRASSTTRRGAAAKAPSRTKARTSPQRATSKSGPKRRTIARPPVQAEPEEFATVGGPSGRRQARDYEPPPGPRPDEPKWEGERTSGSEETATLPEAGGESNPRGGLFRRFRRNRTE